MMLLPTGVNNRNGLKVLKMAAISRIVEEVGETPVGVRPLEAPAKDLFPEW